MQIRRSQVNVFILPFFLVSLGEAQTFSYEKLSVMRPTIGAPQLTDDEKLRTTKQASLILEKVFVHQGAKLDHHGVDVAALGSTFAAEASTLSQVDYFDKLGTAFLSNRDLHTNYIFPAKYLCYRQILPFTVERIEGDRLVVTALRTDAPVVNLSPGLAQLALGDELVEYQGLTALQAVEKKSPLSAGANKDAYFNGGARYLSWNPVAKPMPTEDEVALKFRKADGTVVDLTLPWITRIDQGCLATGARRPLEFDRTRPRKRFVDGTSEDELEFRQAFKDAHQARGELTDTEEPEIKYSIVENTDGRFGWLRLNSFAPAKKGADEAVGIVEDILANKFRNTDGLIIDLRSNPGGNILYADKLAQLFLSDDKELIHFRLRANDTLQYYFSHQKDEFASMALPMLEKINQALAAGKEYTETFPLGIASGVHKRGTAYFKPVVLLTNGSCYSSCDMFSATLQDHGRVTVVGVDGTTGGGGANVWTSGDLYGSLREGQQGAFQNLPQGQEMRVAIRQTVRGKNHDGKLLEDIGVESDVVMRTTLNDILDKDVERIPKLTAILAGLPRRTESIYFANAGDLLNLADATSSLDFEVTGIDKIRLYQGNNQIAERAVTDTQLSVPLTDTTFQTSQAAGNLKVRAYQSQNGTEIQVAQIKKSYRMLPALQTLPLAVTDAASAAAKTRILNFETDADKGWQFVNGSFRIGDGTIYAPGINSELALQVRAAATTQVSFKLTLSSEKDWDFFEVVALVDGKYHSLSGLLSGELAEHARTFSLAPFTGKNIVLLLRFTADDNTESRGATVKDLKVETI